jgi:hypothetical protein
VSPGDTGDALEIGIKHGADSELLRLVICVVVFSFLFFFCFLFFYIF